MTLEQTPQRPVIVGFDPQTLDRGPVRFGVVAARLTGSPLIVASVCAPAPIADSLPAVYAEEDLVPLREQAFADLNEELDAADLSIDYQVLRGTGAARRLHEAADQGHARLLVVGSTHRGAIGKVLPGSTAERLMHGAPCAVAVVPADWDAKHGLRTIGVGLADTDEGLAALRGAYSLASHAGATLRVLSVLRERPAMQAEVEASGRYERGRDLIDVEGAHRVELEAAMRETVAQLPGLVSDVTVSIDAFVGDPADTLNRVSENLDLLVCGSRGYGPLHAAAVGGVSRRVISGACCPVIVLARGVEALLEPLERPELAQPAA